jgi:hypothetical protein
MSLGITGDRVPPGKKFFFNNNMNFNNELKIAWHGWLAH